MTDNSSQDAAAEKLPDFVVDRADRFGLKIRFSTSQLILPKRPADRIGKLSGNGLSEMRITQ
jgi:hypothetical protein